MTLQGKNIALRALEPEDIELLYQWENDVALWEVSNTRAPFSRYALKQYLATACEDIYSSKQLRLVVQNEESQPVGLIDLFDFEPYHQRAGIGIHICKTQEGKGYATEAITILKNYAKETLGLRQLYCNIQSKNEKSIYLFENQGFLMVGKKKDWLRAADGSWEDELLLQCFL